MTQVTLRAYQEEIDHLIDEARFLEAFAHLRHILSQYPRYAEAYYLLGKTMLEADLPQLAVDMFRRVIVANPEHLLARAGLGEAHMQLDNLNAAIWNLERTFELSPGDPDLAEVLRRLYGRRDGAEPAHIPLTRAALARLYLRANLYGRAADELRPLLDKEPQRVDLQLALAEAYWRDGQVVQAADACQRVLDQLPYCLKANLLLGDLWLTSGQEEGERYLKRAQEVDPEGVLAQEILGPTSSVPAQEVTLERLTYKPEAVEGDRSAEWFKRLEAASATVGISEAIPEMTAGEMQLVDLTASLETQIQIPDWLRDLGAGGEEAGLGGFDWMGVAVTEAGPAEAGEREAAVPDWLREFEAQAGVAEGVAPPEAAEAPDWLSAFQAAPAAPAAEVTEAVPPVEEGVPDWLRELQPEAAGEEISTQELPVAPAEGIPEWLRELQPPAAAPAAAVPAEAEGLPDWLRGLQPPAAAGEAAPVVEGEAFPTWLEEAPSPAQAAEEEIPPAELPAVEEAIPEWLKAMQPSAAVTGGMEEEEETATLELPAMEEAIPEWLQAMQPPAAVTEEEEEETATLELPAAEEALPDWLQAAPSAAVVEAAPAAPAEEGLPDWLREFQPPAEAAPAAELPPTPAGEGVPEWLRELQLPPEAPEAPTPEAEAMFGWLSFGGETTEVEAPPAAPSRAELAEPVELAEPTEEAPAPVQEAATPEAFFGWMAFGPEVTEVAAPVAEVPPPAPVEIAAPPVEVPPPAPVTEAAPAAPAPAEEGLLSGDDALAWLASLTVGKEEELRAQAEAEAQVRVAEILGRKPAEVAPPPAPAPVAEVPPPPAPVEIAAPPVEVPPPAPVAEAAPAAPPPAEEGLLSGDDALAWLASLTVGKEAELRAQAEAEAQVRVAEILGRKPAEVAPPPAPAPVAEVPPPPAPVEIAAPPVEVPPPAPVTEAAPAAPPPAEEGLLSGDDALAWLASLTVGKEAELRAQAEAEAQVRVAEILGRKPAEVAPPPAPAPVAEVPPPPAPVEVAAPPVEVPPPAPVAEAAPAAPPPAEEGLLSGDDALAWLASLTVGKEAELRAQAEAEAQVRVAEILGRKPAEVAPPPAPAPVAEVPPPPAPVEIAAPPVEEVTPLPPPAVEAAPAVPFAPEKEAAPPVVEVPPPAPATKVVPPVVEVPPPTPVVKAAPPVVETPPPPAPVVPPAAKVTPPPPPARKPTPPPPAAEEARPAPARPKPAPRPPTPPVTPPAAVPAAGLEALREQVRVHKNDHEARLALARALWSANETEEALSHYTRLIRAKMLMREVFTDLERYIQERPRVPQLWRTLGDAYMKDGQMNKAMETYNQAMSLL